MDLFTPTLIGGKVETSKASTQLTCRIEYFTLCQFSNELSVCSNTVNKDGEFEIICNHFCFFAIQTISVIVQAMLCLLQETIKKLSMKINLDISVEQNPKTQCVKVLTETISYVL